MTLRVINSPSKKLIEMTGLHFLINNKGVSETVGFIIIFGIVITGISLVTLLGYPALLNQQQEANIRNMEKNFIVLQVNANNLAYKNLPYQPLFR